MTSTQSERPVDESPMSVLVLRRKDLERSGTLDLSQTLNQAPGVTLSVVENSARGGGPGVSIQGLAGKRVLVLLNGRPFVGDSDGVVDITTIPVAVIERIEVVAGPMSVLYGAGAIGGVVNVITRQARAGEGGPHLNTNFRYGTYNSLDTSQSLSYGASNISALLVGAYSATDGFDLDPTLIDTNGERARRSSAFNSMDWKVKPNLDVRLDSFFQTSDRLRIYAEDQTATIGRYYYHNWAWDERRLFTTLSTEWTRSRYWLSGWISASVHNKGASDTIQGGEEASYRDSKARDLNGRGQMTYLLGSNGFLLGGLEWHQQTLSIDTIYVDAEGTEAEPISEVGASTLTQAELFALGDIIALNDSLELYGGLRLNYTNLFGFYPPMVLNLRYRPAASVNLRASTGLGYRTPNLKELNYQFDHSAFGYIIYGNPDLVPERSLNLNLSAEYEHPARGMLRAGYFFNEVIHLIDYGSPTVENGLQIFQLTNIPGGVVTQGGEAIGSARFDAFNLTMAYQYLDARKQDTGLPLLYRSTHTGKLNATWRARSGLELSAVGRYQGRQYVSDGGDIEDPSSCLSAYAGSLSGPGWNRTVLDDAIGSCYLQSQPFVVLDANLQSRFTLPGDPLALVFYAGVNNLTNVVRDPTALTTNNTEGNQTLDVRPMPGRTWYFGLRGDL